MSRDAGDEMLDDLLRGANEDLRNSLSLVVDVERTVTSIVGRGSFDAGSSPDVAESRSVAGLIDAIERDVAQLPGDAPMRGNLRLLRDGLEARRLSRTEAIVLMDSMATEAQLLRASSGLAYRLRRDLRHLRTAVSQLFDDAEEWCSIS